PVGELHLTPRLRSPRRPEAGGRPALPELLRRLGPARATSRPVRAPDSPLPMFFLSGTCCGALGRSLQARGRRHPCDPGAAERAESAFPFGPRRSLALLAAQVGEPRQPPLAGQAVYGGQESLQPGERLLAFQPDQFGGALLPCVVPAARHLDLVLCDVL